MNAAVGEPPSEEVLLAEPVASAVPAAVVVAVVAVGEAVAAAVAAEEAMVGADKNLQCAGQGPWPDFLSSVQCRRQQRQAQRPLVSAPFWLFLL